MVTPALIEKLYASTLAPRLQALESLRRSLKSYITKAALCVAVPFGLFFLSDVFTGGLSGGVGMLVTVGMFGLIFVGVAVAAFTFAIPGFTAYANYKVRFKNEVAAEVFRIVNPSAKYSPMHGVSKEDFDEPGLFNTQGGFRSDDRVRGVMGHTPFEAAEVRRSYSTGGKNSTTTVVFHGLFFHLDFNKTLRGVTLVQPEDAQYSQLGSRQGLAKVALESPAFEEAFAVYASDEVEARYILTPGMMERILSLKARAGKPIFLAFKNNRAYLGVHYGRELFEPGIASTTSLESIQEMAAHFGLAEGVVHELDLNTRIWTKGVDASLLARQDEEPDALNRLTSSGEITPSQLWEAAQSAVSKDHPIPSTPVPAPAGTGIQIEQGPGTVTVRYGLSVGFFIALGLWGLACVVALAAAPSLPEAFDVPDLAPLTAWIPPMPYASDLVRSFPPGWFFAACVLGIVTFPLWVTRVRMVEIAPDAVRIWRGLRPVPRTYPRPDYGKVVRIENMVYVGRVEGLNLVNPSASPMMTADETPWVAYEMRRALSDTPAAPR